MTMKITGTLLVAILTIFTGCSSPPQRVALSGPIPSPSPAIQSQSDFVPPNSYSYELIPLKLYWNGRTDNMTTTAPLDQQDTVAGYQFVRIEGYVFTKPQTGTVPLKQYWSAERADYQLTMTAQSEKDALSAGYRFIRVEGYTYPSWQPGLVPLNLYYNPDRQDNFVAASAQAGLDATNTAYHYVRTEGYIIPDRH
jgi:hypothetical protein